MTIEIHRRATSGARLIFSGAALLVLVAFTGCWRSPPDINRVGGVALVYQLEETAAPAGQQRGVLENVAAVIKRRLDPAGRRGVTVEPLGNNQVRVAIPGAAPGPGLERDKRLIVAPGVLEFRILANPLDHEYIIDYALNEEFNRGAAEVKDKDGEVLGRWVALGNDHHGAYPMSPLGSIFRNGETGAPLTDEEGNLLPEFLPAEPDERDALFEEFGNATTGTRREQEYFEETLGIGRIELLVAVDDGYDVSGAHLAAVSAGIDDAGSSSINFTMSEEGAVLFQGFTAENAPDPQTGFRRRIAILLDNQVVTAPELRSAIGRQGQITGRFTQEEVDDLVTILRVGALPARLREEPIAEEIVTPAE
jgi:SecD/SecF fusion protein